MTDELIKKADLYANNTRFTEYDNPSLSESLDISEEIKQAYIAGAKEMQKENEELKQQVSYLEDNLRVARKDREDLRDSVANGLEEFIKEKPHTSLVLLANKEIKEENEQLKSQVEKMKCCENCDGWDYISTGERSCMETCCSNRSNWRLRDRS